MRKEKKCARQKGGWQRVFRCRVSFPGVGTTSEGSGTTCSLLSLEYPAEETGGSSVTSGDGSHRPRQELAYGPVNFGGRG